MPRADMSMSRISAITPSLSTASVRAARSRSSVRWRPGVDPTRLTPVSDRTLIGADTGDHVSMHGGLKFVVPPSSAQGSQEAGAVGELLHWSVHIAEPRLRVGALRYDQVQYRGGSHRVALLLQLQRLEGDVHRVPIDSEDLRIVLQRPQIVGNLPERFEHHGLIGGGFGLEGIASRTHLRAQRSALE